MPDEPLIWCTHIKREQLFGTWVWVFRDPTCPTDTCYVFSLDECPKCGTTSPEVPDA